MALSIDQIVAISYAKVLNQYRYPFGCKYKNLRYRHKHPHQSPNQWTNSPFLKSLHQNNSSNSPYIITSKKS